MFVNIMYLYSTHLNNILSHRTIRLLKNKTYVILSRWFFVMLLLNIFLYLSILFKRVIFFYCYVQIYDFIIFMNI